VGRADEIRASVPAGASVAEDVARIIAGVRSGGDAALEEFEVGFGAGTRAPFTAEAGELDDAVRAGLEVAIHNVRAVAEAGLDDDRLVTLPQGHSVKLRDVPVRRAAVYALSQLADGAALSALRALEADPDVEVRKAVSFALHSLRASSPASEREN
jgi:histidinol dehydrogenase